MAKPIVERSDRQPPDLDSLRAAVRQTPETAESHRRLAWGLYGARSYHEALEAFRNGLDRFPDDEPLLFGLGLTAKRMGQTDQAIEAFARTAALAEAMSDPGKSEILHRLATGQQNHLRSGRWGLKKEVWGES